MRILLITNTYPKNVIGGAEIQTLILARGLMEYGHEVTFLALSAGEKSRATIEGLDVIAIPGRDQVGTARHRRYLERAILESRCEICYVRAFGDFRWVIPFCNTSGIPVIAICCSRRDVSPFCRTNPRKLFIDTITLRQIGRVLNFHSMQLSDEIVCNTGALRDGLRNWYPRKSIRVIYNGHQVPPDEEVHRTYAKRVIWVNNIKQVKRPELYIKLAGCLPEVEFVMIGRLGEQGRYNQYIRSLIERAPGNLKYMGALPFDQVNTEIAQSDILFYTSKQGEGFGNSLIQAWLRGVPTISLDYDPDGIIEREQIGHCPRDFSQLVEKTRELINNPAALQEYGQRARDYALAHHDSRHMVAVYEALFREVSSQGAAPSLRLVQRTDVIK